MTSLSYSLSQVTAQLCLLWELIRLSPALTGAVLPHHFYTSISPTASFTMSFQRLHPSPAALFSLTLTTCTQPHSGSSLSLPSPSIATAACLRGSFYLWSVHSLHHSLAASSSKHLLPFPGCPLAIRHSPDLLSCLPSDLCSRKFSFFHMYLQTWKELCHRDTETPAHSILSTYSYCLSACTHLLLPTRYIDFMIFGDIYISYT